MEPIQIDPAEMLQAIEALDPHLFALAKHQVVVQKQAEYIAKLENEMDAKEEPEVVDDKPGG